MGPSTKQLLKDLIQSLLKIANQNGQIKVSKKAIIRAPPTNFDGVLLFWALSVCSSTCVGTLNLSHLSPHFFQI